MLAPEQLKTILVGSGYITKEDFDAALATAKQLKQTVADQLVFKGYITEDALGKIVAEYYRVPFVSLKKTTIPLETLQLIPEQAAYSFHVIPFKVEGNTLHLAMENPQDLEALEFVKRKTNKIVKAYYIPTDDYAKSVGQYKKNIKQVFEQIINENVKKAKTSGNAQEVAEDVSVVTILDTILEFASAEGASDVHMELMEDVLLLRFRVDGMLHDVANLPKVIHPAILARIKILSELKIDEHRVPQDGRFKFKIREDFIALRVSILPSFYGENIVMRLLPESARALSLSELGMIGSNKDLIQDNINKPNGMILVTGPTGSGKTTTLYTVLNMLNTPDRKICTIEDPVEYSVRRINQTQVNNQAGMDFAAGLRALLRHDPDVIMIGEIRDNETANIAIHSALTGHLVLSTLHTNSAAGAVPRFKDMEVQGFLLASTLNIVIAQRLVRRICTNCMIKIQPTADMQKFIHEHKSQDSIPINDVFIGQGCNECGGKGYRGRISIFEVLNVTPEIKELIAADTSEEVIANKAKELGMSTLVSDGLNKVSAGLTTIDEVIRVTTE